jgi:hypothetical protein
MTPSLHGKWSRGSLGGPSARNPSSHPGSARRVWSVYGALRAQPVATGGKSEDPGNGGNKPKPLPPVATSCRRTLMVRRGSTVRVRQRACTKALQMGMLCCPRWRDLDSSRVQDGCILDWRTLAGTRDVARHKHGDGLRTRDCDLREEISCKWATRCCPCRREADASFAREGVAPALRVRARCDMRASVWRRSWKRR